MGDYCVTNTAQIKPAWAAGLLCLLLACSVHAQDPFDDAASDDPFGESAAGDVAFDAAAPAVSATPAVALEREDPLVLDILNGVLQTPSQVTQAVRNLLNWGRPDKAKELLTTLLAKPPPADQLAPLAGRFGSAFFLRLAQEEALAPEGRQFAELVLAAADNARRNSARLAALALQAVDASPQIRALATNALRKAGQGGVAPLVDLLADAAQGDAHPLAQRALLEMGGVSVEPLLAVLESNDENLRTLVIEVLGDLRATRAVGFLAAPHVSTKRSAAERAAAGEALISIVGVRPTKAAAEALLWRRANAFLDGAPPLRADQNNNIWLWHWDDAAKPGSRLTRVLLRADDASLLTALRLAADLHHLAPKKEAYRRLYLITLLQSEKISHGLFRPLPHHVQGAAGGAREFAEQMGAAFVEATLAQAMKKDYLPAAIGAAEILGDIGDVSLLETHAGRGPILLDALRHRNRRLVFAAAQAIMRLAPERNYGGLSYFTQTLGFLARSQGVRRVLVVHPRSTFGQSLAGILNGLGFEADTAINGREAFRMAAKNPDYEFIMLSDAINDPPISHLIQWIRRDRRTAAIPIGLLTHEERRVSGDTLAEKYSRVLALPQPRTPLGAGLAIKRLQPFWDRQYVSPEERLVHAASAFDWLTLLLETPAGRPAYDLRSLEKTMERGLFTDPLAERAASALGLLGTPLAQQALVNMASLSSAPLELRQAALQAFQEAVHRRRVMLTSSEIHLQYDRYNASETSSVESQQILGAILDILESGSQGGKGNAAENTAPVENTAPAEQPAPQVAAGGE